LAEFVDADGFDSFDIDDECIFNFKVGHIFINFYISINYWVAGLLAILNVEVCELHGQSAFISLLPKLVADLRVNRHRRANHFVDRGLCFSFILYLSKLPTQSLNTK
jgi:hypothetical protein